MERKTIAERLEGNLIEQKPDGQSSAPRCYRVTGAKKEKPDVWVRDPSRSITLEVKLLGLLLPNCGSLAYVQVSTDVSTFQSD